MRSTQRIILNIIKSLPSVQLLGKNFITFLFPNIEMYLLIKFIAQELQSSERNQGKQYLI